MGKLTELRQTIDLRRTRGAAPALDLVLGGQGMHTMTQLRGVCSEMQSRNRLAQSKALRKGEAVAQIALLVTTVGSLILLFFFVAVVEPIMSADPRAKRRSQLLLFGISVVVTLAATLLRMALTPVIGGAATPFVMFFPAVLIAACRPANGVGRYLLTIPQLDCGFLGRATRPAKIWCHGPPARA